MSPLDDQFVVAQAPARRSGDVVAQLNDRWRVAHDPLQWILQVRQGRKVIRDRRGRKAIRVRKGRKVTLVRKDRRAIRVRRGR